MKKLVLLAGILVFVTACNQLKDNEFLIKGKINGVTDGKKVYVEVPTETGSTFKDTGVVKKGNFELKGTIEGMELAFIRVEEQEFNLPIILENGEITAIINKDTIQKSSVTGTKNNDLFQKFNDDSKVISEKVTQFQKDNGPKMLNAQKNKDTVTINALRKEYESYQEEMNLHSKKFIKEHPEAYLSVLLLENFLMRNYLQTSEITELYDKLADDVKKTKSGERIKTSLNAIKTIVIGKPAPDFSGPTPDSSIVSLKASLGKVTIIDFWASWCGPCRAENPNVVALYNEFHSKGLNIIGVSLDKDAAKWKDAIAKDGLVWQHVSNLKYWDDPIAKQYNIKAIPATFILDEKGIIVAKDLRGNELKAKVKELLGVK